MPLFRSSSRPARAAAFAPLLALSFLAALPALALDGGELVGTPPISSEPDAGLDAADAGVSASSEGSAAPAPPVPARAIPYSTPAGFKRARLSVLEAPSQQELDDRQGLAHPRCSPGWGVVFPGLGALCAGRETEGEILVAAGVLELGTGIAVGIKEGFGNTGAELPLLGFGDLFTAASIEASLRVERARHLPYVPQETLADDFSAPFRPDVLKQPDVYLGIVGLVGLGVLFEQYLDGPLSTQTVGQRPVLFGHNVNNAVAYPLATAIGAGLFSQVATAEEIAFRGMVQSRLTRNYGEIPGWIGGSLIFGLFHASNAIFLPADQRVEYLTHGVPFITIVGSYLGFTYMNHDYSLSPSIAVHFWYDFFIEAISFILDPKNSPLAFTYAF